MDCEFLRSVSFLKELTNEDLLAFSRLFSVSKIPPGERIVEEGRVRSAFYIVCKGTVHVRRTAQKRELLLGRIGSGGFFGEINLFDPGVATGSVYAMDLVSLASADYELLREFMSENPAAGYKIVSALMAEVSRRLRLTNQRFVNSVYWASEGLPSS